MRVFVGGTEMVSRVPVFSMQPREVSLDTIPSAYVVVDDPASTLTAAQLPREYHEVIIYKDDGVTMLFGGYVNTLTHLGDSPIGRTWGLKCAGYEGRLRETQTGSLDKSATTDSDRNFVIAILRSALATQSFGAASLDDAIITANEPDWTGVQQTTFLAGLDFSYKDPRAAIDALRAYIPNVYLSIGADRIVQYGRLATLAPFALSSSPNGTTTKGYENYSEEVVEADHRNKIHRGGASASDVTAYDEVSMAKFGRILDAGYKADTSVLASDLTRRTYAELRTLRVRHRVMFSVRDEGLEPGQAVDIVNTRLGSGTRPGVMCVTEPLFARSPSGAIAGERGRFFITKVRQATLGNQNYRWDVEAGDLVTGFQYQLPATTRS